MTPIFQSTHLSALLGPTNTGKTWRARSRMLAHESGMIGFPLRLLARENYERLVAEKGVTNVALVTGEEKIIPPRAKWFSCTVEAMPLERSFAFVAIDEIQLCTDPERGHIFTDRLLRCRGTKETLFLGSDTMRHVLKRLFPKIEIEMRPRLSALSYAGHSPLSKLPPRSAVVAFSVGEVYAIADTLTRRRGGCAIVMGQLSPRTRNAQVALFQNREVDYIVATDAIGMGLNMDIDHVALAAQDKFDGARFRPLTLLEMAQIFGRAGRGLQNGTFGTTADARPLDIATARAIEAHQFPRAEAINWRHADLDFRTPATLRRSLETPPSLFGMQRGRDASDILTLIALMQSEAIMAQARDQNHTKLLWDICQIPDFRKLGDASHTTVCGQLFLSIAQEGQVPDTWFSSQMARLNRVEGDIETLMQRLTAIRICAYVASKEAWSPRHDAWAKRTRVVEDALSDALHEKLKARYLDRKASALSRHLKERGGRAAHAAIVKGDKLVVEGHLVGTLSGLGYTLDPDLSTTARAFADKAGRRALLQHMPQRVARIIASNQEAFFIDPATRLLLWEGAALARLVRGHTALSPSLRLLSDEALSSASRQLLLERLHAVVRTIIQNRFNKLFKILQQKPLSPETRGLHHRLQETIGVIPVNKHKVGKAQGTFPSGGLRGVVYGTRSLFVPEVLSREAGALRMGLLSLFYEWKLPQRDYQRVCYRAEVPPHPANIVSGWLHCGTVDVRLDIAELWLKKLSRLVRQKSAPLPHGFMSSLGLRRKDVPAVLKGWGIDAYIAPPMDPRHYGPIAPIILKKRIVKRNVTNRKRKETKKIRPSPDESPFAILKGWRGV